MRLSIITLYGDLFTILFTQALSQAEQWQGQQQGCCNLISFIRLLNSSNVIDVSLYTINIFLRDSKESLVISKGYVDRHFLTQNFKIILIVNYQHIIFLIAAVLSVPQIETQLEYSVYCICTFAVSLVNYLV